MSNLDYKPHYRRNLPHIQPPGATLFVTFRLTGSIPRAVLDEWSRHKARFEAELRKLAPPERKQREREFQRDRFARLEKYLDKAETGPKWLAESAVAQIVANNLHRQDGTAYRLDAYCIMPNHGHVVLTPLPVAQASACDAGPQAKACATSADDSPYYALPAIMHSLKGRTAREANLLLGRRGEFWEHESYDHWVRDEDEFARIVAYVLNNPMKAGLIAHGQTWPWIYCRTPA